MCLFFECVCVCVCVSTLEIVFQRCVSLQQSRVLGDCFSQSQPQCHEWGEIEMFLDESHSSGFRFVGNETNWTSSKQMRW